MRRSRASFSGSDLSIHTRSLADFITIMCGFRFSVHTHFLHRLPEAKRAVDDREFGASGAGVLAIDQAAADACSKPPIASRVMSSVSSSVNGSSVVMLNGSWANSSRFRTKMLHWPISQMATLRGDPFRCAWR
jgi:hypothetical protein